MKWVKTWRIGVQSFSFGELVSNINFGELVSNINFGRFLVSNINFGRFLEFNINFAAQRFNSWRNYSVLKRCTPKEQQS